MIHRIPGLALLCVGLGVTGCVPEEEGYLLRVNHQGLAARMGILCHYGMDGGSDTTSCPTDSPPASPAPTREKVAESAPPRVASK